jgi:hypothetical protein
MAQVRLHVRAFDVGERATDIENQGLQWSVGHGDDP